MTKEELKTKAVEIWNYFHAGRMAILFGCSICSWLLMFIIWMIHGKPQWLNVIGSGAGYFIGLFFALAIIKVAILLWNENV